MPSTWKRVASVTSGGKRYFWVRYTPDRRQLIVVWDRQVRAWAAQIEDSRLNGHGRTVEYCSTALQAKRSLDRRETDGFR